MPERVWYPEGPFDLRRTLSPLRRGTGDPTVRDGDDGAIWWAARTGAGPGTLRMRVLRIPQGASTPPAGGPPGVPPASGDAVHATGYGPGAGELLDRLPELLGAGDDTATFVPVHEPVRRAARRLGGMRIGRTGRVFDMLVPAVLEQKVVGTEAFRAWRLLVRRYGEAAPGPFSGLYVPPAPAGWAAIPSWEWHRAGVEAVRARTIVGAARVADRLEGHGSAETDRRLRSLPGIGVWTSAEVRQRSHGDPDAVSVGDYHLPSLVGWTLAGRRVDDAGMLELLAPYAGHRYRVTRMIELAGSRPPRRGPRMAPRDYRRI